jgi:hypothetical protein
MDWKDIPILVVLGIAVLGLSLMLAAFVLMARRGGWEPAMQPDAQGRWPLPRYLMLAGASLGCLFALLLSVPGVVPWWDYSQWYTWLPGLGVALGGAFGGLAWGARRWRRQ